MAGSNPMGSVLASPSAKHPSEREPNPEGLSKGGGDGRTLRVSSNPQTLRGARVVWHGRGPVVNGVGGEFWGYRLGRRPKRCVGMLELNL